MCLFKDMDCVKKIDPEDHKCLPPCEGLYVTGYTKSDKINDIDSLNNDYSKYKGHFSFPPGMKGIYRFGHFI